MEKTILPEYFTLKRVVDWTGCGMWSKTL